MRYHHLLLLPPVLGVTPENLWTTREFELPWGLPNRWTTKSDPEELPEGTCNSAVDVMAYHRDKMHEYLCKRYLAEEIVAAERGEVMESRADNSQLLQDAGSENYKDWLARSTTLEDIYKHYEQNAAGDAPIPARLPLDPFDGEVTGYAMLGTNKVAVDNNDYAGGSYGASPGYGSSQSYGTSHQSYGVPQYHFTKSSGSDKGMKLNDLFQLALTAIAFMAFGTFACEIIMCIMGIETNASVKKQPQVILFNSPDQLEANKYYKTADGFVDDPNASPEMEQIGLIQNPEPNQSTFKWTSRRRARGDGEKKKRTPKMLDVLSEVAQYATASLDGMETSLQDGGKSLQKTLCEANVYSRSLSGTQRIWLPMWSFGMSWIGGKQLPGTSFGSIKLLTATVQGMAGFNCSQMLM